MMLECRQLSLRLNGKALLSALDWQVSAGECWWIAGRNGCGKSTLLATLAGQQPRDSGDILLHGRPLAAFSPRERARHLALLPQQQYDAFDYSVHDAVAAARFAWPDDGGNARRVHSALTTFDLARLAARPLQALSGGERQRVALAGVMVQDAPLILLDEPSVALDLAHQAALGRQIGNWCAAGKAVVLVSHDLQWAPACASHVLLLDGHGGHTQCRQSRLDADSLARVLGYPLTRITHAGQPCFLPGASA